MWAQLISVRVKEGREADIPIVARLLRQAEQPDSGLLRELVMVEQGDPRQIHTIAVFESEEAAREREADPRRAEGLAALQQLLGQIVDGPPTFRDLNVVDEFVP